MAEGPSCETIETCSRSSIPSVSRVGPGAKVGTKENVCILSCSDPLWVLCVIDSSYGFELNYVHEARQNRMGNQLRLRVIIL